MSRYLTIFEVSQKQKFIFSTNKLAGCIRNSSVVAYITSSQFIKDRTSDSSLFNEESNLVYSGGGHIILEFDSNETAVQVTHDVSRHIVEDYPEIEFFAHTTQYEADLSPSENVRKLTMGLERKKSLRASVFMQGSFGVEMPPEQAESYKNITIKQEIMPEGYTSTTKLSELGGRAGDSNFIAVVHIDGNAMGKRVEAVSSSLDCKGWNAYKNKMRAFSRAVAEDFDDAYEEMKATVENNLNSGNLSALSLSYDNDGRIRFPVRKVISEGDDICFISDGRIGIECAAMFLKKLAQKTNSVDGKKYASCAGVAIVHQKYPFYRAYELAEELCNSAKRFGAGLDQDGNGAYVSAIDWHIEYGEFHDSLEETRELYDTEDGKRLELRPYIVEAPDTVLEKEKIRQYETFRRLLGERMKNAGYSSGTLKEMRNVLKKGEAETKYYLKYHKSESIGRDFFYGIYEELHPEKTFELPGGLDQKIFIRTQDGKDRSIMFDAIEAIDVFIKLEEGQGNES